MSRARLINQFTQALSDCELTIDAVVVVGQDRAYAIGYDAAERYYVILEGERNAEGVYFAVRPGSPGYSDIEFALGVVADLIGETI